MSAFINITHGEDPHARYKMPSASISYSSRQGGVTIVENLDVIAKSLERDPEHVFGYIKKSLSTGGNKHQLKGTFSASILQSIIRGYIDKFVLCQKCRLPETVFSPKYLTCKACGSRTKL